MKFSSIVAGFFTLMTVARASVIQEQEPNNDVNTAQQIPVAAFTLGYNPIIANSATLPWVTIDGTGDGTNDFYSFVVPDSGMIASIFDIDHITHPYDAYVTLYDSNGNYLAHNDDQSPADPGSHTALDSYLTYTFNAPGVYVVKVGRFPSNQPVPTGATYQLHISLGYTEAQLRAAYGMGDPHFKVRHSRL
ncbi:Hemolysin-type calcium-binding repeat (2 copies) [Seminavis robusta]|uniref:Hemolysin-type calcium-binding repeat (2 copies) n=1 Tax=Seminavis robusta TaxID=568900 RepID=A0A9N8ETY4_9STRA|nr:Hemolysin-type calcium-binding repeat (2 copies) [Seminavis robusta]|eukprot:Sro1563_g282720.1 Hemolysin-type calcium-binding repeat (2 copies) (191) ;mRNA; f:24170-24819